MLLEYLLTEAKHLIKLIIKSVSSSPFPLPSIFIIIFPTYQCPELLVTIN